MARPPILTLTDISLGFGGNPLFDGLSLAINEGDRLCLVGRNGSGKSTLMKVIAGMTEPDSGNRFLKPGNTVGYMDQDPDFSGFETLGDYARQSIDPSEAYRVDIVAEGLGLDLAISPLTASGGEKRRAALAKIMGEAPECMLLDEPTNHLDIAAIEWLEDYLRDTRTAYVLISHDRTFLRSLTRGTIWIDRGMARQQDRGFDRFEDWRDKIYEEEDQERHKLNRLIKSEARWAVEGISARRKRNQGRVRRLAGLREEKASQIKRSGVAAMELDEGGKSGKRVIEARGISKSFGDHVILKPFDLRVMRGERIALVGPNGAGKTTLLKMLIGTMAPDSGSVKLGTNLDLAVFDQTRSALEPKKSLWESMTDDPELGVSGKNDQIMVRGSARHVVGYLKDFLFDEKQIRGPVSVLSGGEKARLLLARLMAKPSNLLVMDEPTNDLDIETLDLMQELLDGYGGTVLLVSHDRDFLDRVATTTIAMEGNGKATVYAGGWSDYQSQRQAIEAPDLETPKAKPKRETTQPDKGQAKAPALTFTEQHRLETLPDEIERLGREIAKLEEFLADPTLFHAAPDKFTKASEGLAERINAREQAEEEWLVLAEKADI